jgi:hypothetical protein
MKISRLIARLQKLEKKHGDLDVCFYNKSESGFEYIDCVEPEYKTLYIDGKPQWGKCDLSKPPWTFVIRS